ncbi:MAG: HAMP domain-containing protein, partial [Spirochaetaceae bacterium]
IESLLFVDLAIEEVIVAQRTLMAEFLTIEQRTRQLENFREARRELYEQWEYFKTLPAIAEEVRISDRIDVELAEWSELNNRWLAMTEAFNATGILDPGDLVGHIQQFIGDHYKLELEVVMAIHTGGDIAGGGNAIVGGDDPTACNFGRWLATFTTGNAELRRLIDASRQSHDRFHRSVLPIRAQLRAGNSAEALRVLQQEMLPASEGVFAAFDDMLALAERADAARDEINLLAMGRLYDEARDVMGLIDELIHINENIAAAEVARADVVSTQVITVIIVGMLVGFVIAVVLGLILTKGITGPVAMSVALAQKLADGDLTASIDVDQKDEIGVLAKAMREMRDRLAEVMTEVQTTAENVASGSSQVAQSSQSLSQGSTEQASSLEEISASLNEVNSQSTQNAENSTEASAVAKGALQAAQAGNEQMHSLIAVMERINESSDEINKVVKVIDDIAFQINLLALNANVEAARAGKYGKGFAVVAEEVRNLAGRSAQAAKETASMVEATTRNIVDGNAAAQTTSKQLQEIVTGASKVADFLEEIAVASKEQAQGVEQINQGLSQVDQVTQSNTANAEEGAAAAEEMSAQAQQLFSLISTFKLAQDSGRPRQKHLALPHDTRQQAAYGERKPAMAQGRAKPVATAGDHEDGSGVSKRANRAPATISLDDDDFGKF